mgnify:CR=1 FL=1
MAFFQAGVLIVIDGHRGGLETGHVHVLDLEQIGAGQDGVLHLEHLAVLGLVLQQVAVGTHIDAGGGDHLLPGWHRMGGLVTCANRC